jgi:hypothetical protein
VDALLISSDLEPLTDCMSLITSTLTEFDSLIAILAFFHLFFDFLNFRKKNQICITYVLLIMGLCSWYVGLLYINHVLGM